MTGRIYTGFGHGVFDLAIRKELSLAGAAAQAVALASSVGQVLFHEDWSNGFEQWDNVPTRYSVVDDPFSGAPDKALRVGFSSGDSSSPMNTKFHPGFAAHAGVAGYDEWWAEFEIVVPAGFVNERGDGNEMHMIRFAGARTDSPFSAEGQSGEIPDGTDYFSDAIDPAQVNDDQFGPVRFYSQYPSQVADGGDNFGVFLNQNAPAVPHSASVPLSIIYHGRCNTPGQADGLKRLYVDGQLKIERLGQIVRTVSDLQYNCVFFDFYLPGLDVTQEMFVRPFTIYAAEQG